jgi:hypothetical protein
MKDFSNVRLKTEFVNDFGETMKLVVDSNNRIWVHHNDCNNDYQELKNFEYILNGSEIAVMLGFVEAARQIYETNDKTGLDFNEFHSEGNSNNALLDFILN